MKYLAILSSSDSPLSAAVAETLSGGNKVRVSVILTDSLDVAPDAAWDIKRLYIPEEDWNGNPEKILDILAAHNIDMLLLDNFSRPLPPLLLDVFRDRIVEAPLGTSVSDCMNSIIAVSRGIDATPADSEENTIVEVDVEETKVEETKVEEPLSVATDREWARALHLDYQTPPPVPVTEQPAHPQMNAPQQPVNQPLNQPLNQPYNGYGQQRPMADGPQEPMPRTYLIFSVLATLLCCFIPGIVAIIFSSQVSSRYYQGDIEGARRASSNAEIWIIVSFVLGVMSTTLYLPLMIAGLL